MKATKGFDRGRNPHDGSRRRLKSVAHKSAKDYNRQENKKAVTDYDFDHNFSFGLSIEDVTDEEE